MRCCICGKDMTNQPAMQDNLTGVVYCSSHSEYFYSLKNPDSFPFCQKCGFKYSPTHSQFAQGESQKCPACGNSLTLEEKRKVAQGEEPAMKPSPQPKKNKWWQIFTGQPQSFKPKTRISKIETIASEWGGLIASQIGDTVIYLHGGREIPAGKWLYFLYHLETTADRRIFFSDTACFWLHAQTPFKLQGMGNMYHPLPEGIQRIMTQDGNYAEWRKAFQAIDDYFSRDSGWRYQWSWKSERVEHFMAGKCSDWVSAG